MLSYIERLTSLICIQHWDHGNMNLKCAEISPYSLLFVFTIQVIQIKYEISAFQQKNYAVTMSCLSLKKKKKKKIQF